MKILIRQQQCNLLYYHTSKYNELLFFILFFRALVTLLNRFQALSISDTLLMSHVKMEQLSYMKANYQPRPKTINSITANINKD